MVNEEEDHLPPDEPGLPPGMILAIVLVINTARSITHIKPPMSKNTMVNPIVMTNVESIEAMVSWSFELLNLIISH